MARPPGIEWPRGVCPVTSRGNGGNNLFGDKEDRKRFLSVLNAIVGQYNRLCHAYWLMDNHYHLLIETPDLDPSLGMRQLKGISNEDTKERPEKTKALLLFIKAIAPPY
jgi:REP element-mobilizing transposase RayT